MFVPPEDRRSWHPPKPEGRSKPGEGVLLVLVVLFLLSMLLAPIGGSTLVEALLALTRR